MNRLQFRPFLSNLLAGIAATLVSVLAYQLVRLILHQASGLPFLSWETATLQHPSLVIFGWLPLPALILLAVNLAVGVVYSAAKRMRSDLHKGVNRLSLVSFSLLAFLAVCLLVSQTLPAGVALMTAVVLGLSSVPYFFIMDGLFFPVPRAKRVRKPKPVKVKQPKPQPKPKPVVDKIELQPAATPAEVAPAAPETPAEPHSSTVEILEDGKFALVTMGEDATIENIVHVGPLQPADAPVDAKRPYTPPEAPEASESDDELQERLAAARRELRRDLRGGRDEI